VLAPEMASLEAPGCPTGSFIRSGVFQDVRNAARGRLSRCGNVNA
jgi:hypothetical protein